jgi:GNAT superfamily N-acetyltransferase
MARPFDHLPHSTYGRAHVWVLAGRRRRGVGGALLADCSAHLRAIGRVGVETSADEDCPEAIAFLEHRGFREVRRAQTVALELARWQPSGRPAPVGVTLTTLAASPQLVEGMWQVECEALPDVPSAERLSPPSRERFERELARPGLEPALTFVALTGEVVVGYATLSRSSAQPEVGWHDMTGVRRAWRGRGVAGALKEAQLTAARAAGVARLRATNAMDNQPMRRLNARLGYVREPSEIGFRGPLTDRPLPDEHTS